MKKILYHGSDHIVEKPLYGFGKPSNDYGSGFYCTEHIELAREWAVDYNRNGFCNKYELELDGLSILYLEQYNALVWLTILLKNRTFNTRTPLSSEAKAYLLEHFSIDYKKYDVIIGYRADDSYFTFAQDFIRGTITYQQLTKAMKLGNLGTQVVLISEKAFSQISFIGSEEVKDSDYFPIKTARDDEARSEYFTARNMKRNKDDLFIQQIIDLEMDINDKRL